MARELIGVVQPHLRGGGAEGVTFWVIEALKDRYSVELLTLDKVDLEEINRFYGTNVRADDLAVVTYPLPPFLRVPRGRFSLLGQHLMMRYCKLRARQHDLLFGTCNEMDFGRPGIQYVNLPVLAETSLRERGLVASKKWYHRPSMLRRVYHWVCRSLSHYSEERMKENLTLANSHWTAALVKEIYGIEVRVVYPPVLADFPEVPYSDREQGFVCVGRIAPDKNVLEIINILKGVRREGFNVHLHIVGPGGEKSYVREVFAQQKANASWVFLEGVLDRSSLTRIVAGHRFGIHGMKHEHFGIAVAEMARAGCVVFVPNGGGQVEIVDNDARLVYGSEEDAIEKITRVLADEREQKAISREMIARGFRFSAERFVEEIREAVCGIL